MPIINVRAAFNRAMIGVHQLNGHTYLTPHRWWWSAGGGVRQPSSCSAK